MIPDGATSFPPPPTSVSNRPGAGDASGEDAGASRVHRLRATAVPRVRAGRGRARFHRRRVVVLPGSEVDVRGHDAFAARVRTVSRRRVEDVVSRRRTILFLARRGTVRGTPGGGGGENTRVCGIARRPRVDLHHVRRGGRRARGDARADGGGEKTCVENLDETGGGAVLRQHVQHLHAEPHVSVARRRAAVLAGDGADGVARDARARRRRAGGEPTSGVADGAPRGPRRREARRRRAAEEEAKGTRVTRDVGVPSLRKEAVLTAAHQALGAADDEA